MGLLWNILAVREARKENFWLVLWWEISNGMRIYLNINKRYSKFAMWLKTWQISTTSTEKTWAMKHNFDDTFIIVSVYAL